MATTIGFNSSDIYIYPGIAVGSVPMCDVEEKADTTLSLILNLYRRTYWLATRLAEGKHPIVGPDGLRLAADGATRIRGDTLGIVGLGR